MARKLTSAEIKQVSIFVSSVRPKMTSYQPTMSQQELDAQVPGQIEELLLQLLPLSINDHLLTNYLQHLNKQYDQDAIYSWLKAIETLSPKMKTSEKFSNDGLVHQVLFREAARLAYETSINFTVNALSATAKLPSKISPEMLMTLTKEYIERFKKQKQDDIANGVDKEFNGAYGFYYDTNVNSQILKDEVLARHPEVMVITKRKLLRTRSDSAAIETQSHTKETSPLRPHKPVNDLSYLFLKPRRLY